MDRGRRGPVVLVLPPVLDTARDIVTLRLEARAFVECQFDRQPPLEHTNGARELAKLPS